MSERLPYQGQSIEGRFLAGEPETVGQIMRWISVVVASPRFWRLRRDWLDMHQEIMGRLVASLRQRRFDASQDFRAYVQGVARYTLMESMRPRLQLVTTEEGVEDATLEEPDVDEAVISRQLARVVLDHASDACRELLKVYYYDQRNYEEIAAAQGVPVGTIKSRLARCLESAHRLLKSSRSAVAGDYAT